MSLKFLLQPAKQLGSPDYLIPANEPAQKICDWLDVEKIRVGSKECNGIDFLQYDLGVEVEIFEKRECC